MSAAKLLGLPPITPELKNITPYLQRADELRQREPVMAYWCAYYAAQLGIAAKAKDTASRTILSKLLGALEDIKNSIGPNDGIDIEAVSSAYIENFAFRVFVGADNEDRKGSATRSTAKKFLAAAQFFEVLNIFGSSERLVAAEEKIRYAKWKAGDIAKAFRENRQPTPGPPGWAEEQAIEAQLLMNSQDPYASVSSGSPPASTASPPAGFSPPTMHINPPSSMGSPMTISPPAPSVQVSTPPRTPPKSASPSSRNISPPHSRSSASPPRGPPAPINPQTPHSGLAPVWQSNDLTSPGGWSIIATPGADNASPHTFSSAPESPTSPTTRKGKAVSRKQRSGSGSSSGSTVSGGGGSGQLAQPDKSLIKQFKASVSQELEPGTGQGNGNANAVALGIANGKKSVHFTPSVVGGLSSTDGSPPTTPGGEQEFDFNGAQPSAPPYPPQVFGVPSLHVQTQPASIQPQYPFAPQSAQDGNAAYSPVPSLPPHLQNIYGPPASASSYTTPTYPTAPAPPPMVSDPVELTPATITRVQKHCKFAISALDYDDVEQARKELRAALKMLGG